MRRGLVDFARRSRRAGPRGEPLTRARLPVRRRGASSSSTSKGSGAQSAHASGSVSTVEHGLRAGVDGGGGRPCPHGRGRSQARRRASSAARTILRCAARTTRRHPRGMTRRSSAWTDDAARTREVRWRRADLDRLVTRLRAMDPFRADVLLAAVLLAEVDRRGRVHPGAGRPHAAVGLARLRRPGRRRRAAPPGDDRRRDRDRWRGSAGPERDRATAYTDTLERARSSDRCSCVYSVGAQPRGPAAVAAGSLSAVPAIDRRWRRRRTATRRARRLRGGCPDRARAALLGRVLRNRSRLNRALRDRARRLEQERAGAAPRRPSSRSARASPASCTTSSPTRSARWSCRPPRARRLVRARPGSARRRRSRSVETTGRDALTEIRRLLGVLRREDEDLALAPQPSLPTSARCCGGRRGRAAGRARSRGRRATAARRRRPDRLPGAAGGARRRARGRRAPAAPRCACATAPTRVRGRGLRRRHRRRRRAPAARRCASASRSTAATWSPVRPPAGTRYARGCRSERADEAPALAARGRRVDRALALLLLATAVDRGAHREAPARTAGPQPASRSRC